MAKASYNVPAPDDRATIVCLYCDKPQEVGRRALSITCKYCNKSLKLEDIRVTQYTARRTIDTCGVVTVEKKGQIVADKVLCGGLVVRGKLKAQVISRGPVLVGPDAEIKGDVTAPALAVGAGATLDGRYLIGTKEQLTSVAELLAEPVMREVSSSPPPSQRVS
jgi:hypothetical protein